MVLGWSYLLADVIKNVACLAYGGAFLEIDLRATYLTEQCSAYCGGSQCLDHGTGKIRCILTDAAGSDQSTKCSSASVR